MVLSIVKFCKDSTTNEEEGVPSLRNIPEDLNPPSCDIVSGLQSGEITVLVC
jgi:hypothetical protein